MSDEDTKMGVTLTQFKKELFISDLDNSFKVGQFVKFEGITAAKKEQAIQGTYYIQNATYSNEAKILGI